VSAAHHTRQHTQWAASATARNATCAGAIAMETMCDDKETEAAAWGTCAHQIAERCFRFQADANSFLGNVEKSGKFEFVIDEEMTNCSQEFVDYVLNTSVYGVNCDLWVEQKFSLDSLNPPLQAGGTADAVIFDRREELEVVDLKGGRGVVVEASNNQQMRTYALGALLAFPELKVKFIKTTIVQPRAPHKDGRIRSDTFHVADLLDWSIDLLAKMRRSKQALTEFEALDGSRVKFDAWAETWLQTGNCQFCPAEGICPKRRKEALSIMGDTAQKWFEEPTTEAPLTVGNAPDIASPEELAHWLDGLEALEAWAKSVRGYAHSAAERGVEIPGYMLADKIGNRKWVDEIKASEGLAALGLGEKQIFESKMRSPAQMEKILGAKRKAEIEPLVHQPITGSNLVSADKTTRPAAKGLTERHHENMEN
jgi:hypothetical protein